MLAVSDQAVIVNIPLRGGGGAFDLVGDLGDRLHEHLKRSAVGEFDGNLIGEDLGVLYLYGPDADRLWQEIEPLVRDATLPGGTYVLKRAGPPGDAETRIDL